MHAAQRRVPVPARAAAPAPVRVPAGVARAATAARQGNHALARVLVPIVVADWEQRKKDTIRNRQEALARAQGQALGRFADIARLGRREELWLYSHGSRTKFAGKTAAELVAWLQAKGMPPGRRRITLKGCRTGGYATAVQQLLNAIEGYEAVEVVGFEGEASYTTAEGEMQVRHGSRAELQNAGRAGAMAAIRARRENPRMTREEAAELQARTASAALRFDAVLDEGRGAYIPEDERARRRLKRKPPARDDTPSPEPKAAKRDDDPPPPPPPAPGAAGMPIATQ